MIDKWKLGAAPRLLFLFFVLFLISFLPAFQYGVGYDYFSYVRVFENEDQLDIYFRKGEFAFFYVVSWLKDLGFSAQSLFVSASIFSSFLILFAFRLLWLKGYRYGVLFFCFFSMTGMLHNQMNTIRNYLAVYLFVNSLLCKFSGKYSISFLFGVLGVMFHQTFYLMVPFLLAPTSFYRMISRKIVLFFFLMILFWLSGVSIYLLEYIIVNYASFYQHHLGKILEPSPLINVMTKAYYLPLQIWFVFWVSKSYYDLSSFQRSVIGFWVIGSCIYFGLLHSGLFFRANHYFVFFSIIPAYHFLYSRNSSILKVIFSIYMVFPYLVKVVVFPAGEYQYASWFFS